MTSIAGISADPKDPGQVALWEVAHSMVEAAHAHDCAVTSVHVDMEAGTATVTADRSRREWPPKGGVQYPEGVKLTREDPE